MDRKGINRTAIAAMLAVVMAATVAAQASAPPSASDPIVVEGHSNDPLVAENTIDSRILASMDDATAAALIGALETRFAGREVALRMGAVHGERASLRDIALQGSAQIRLGQDADWLPISFEALYDTDRQSVLSPSITLGAAGVAGTKNATLPLTGLQEQVVKAMASEFASQSVDVSLRDVRVVGNDGHRLVVRAQGVASFDGSETAPITVRAMYEQGTRRWLDAQYDFDVIGS